MLPLETLRWAPSERPYLVSIRTAASIPTWIDYAKPRTWDLLLNYYEPPATIDSRCEMVTLGGVTKFPAIWETNRLHEDFLRHYDAALFLDDDIAVRFDEVDTLFSLFQEFGLVLAQPSLTPQSYSSWPITLCSPSFRLRFTNFVEVMAPIFSRPALAQCLETFPLSKSGWGLDLVWPVLLGNPRDKIAIIDEITMTHTRPVDPKEGAFYEYLRGLGVDPYSEFRELGNAYEIGPGFEPQTYGTVPATTDPKR